MLVQVTPTPEGVVVRLDGDVRGGDAPALWAELATLAEGGGPVAVEVGALGALSAPGLAVLVAAAEQFQAAGTDLSFVGARPRLAPLLSAATTALADGAMPQGGGTGQTSKGS